IDATNDTLVADRVDYDNPLFDPFLPTSAPGTLVLNNVLTFNGVVLSGVHLTTPPLVNAGPPKIFAPIDVGVTPALSLGRPSIMLIDQNGAFVDPGVVALDGCEGDLVNAVVRSGIVDVTTPGTYVVQYTVTNAVGKSAPPIERTVTVRVPPVTTGLFLHGTGPLNASSSLLLTDSAPTSAVAPPQDPTRANFTGCTPWKTVGVRAA